MIAEKKLNDYKLFAKQTLELILLSKQFNAECRQFMRKNP